MLQFVSKFSRFEYQEVSINEHFNLINLKSQNLQFRTQLNYRNTRLMNSQFKKCNVVQFRRKRIPLIQKKLPMSS